MTGLITSHYRTKGDFFCTRLGPGDPSEIPGGALHKRMYKRNWTPCINCQCYERDNSAIPHGYNDYAVRPLVMYMQRITCVYATDGQTQAERGFAACRRDCGLMIHSPRECITMHKRIGRTCTPQGPLRQTPILLYGVCA